MLVINRRNDYSMKKNKNEFQMVFKKMKAFLKIFGNSVHFSFYSLKIHGKIKN
jgi:hypothetical protein